MKKYSTKAIVVRRVNYSEADRIVTCITDKYGMKSALAKGVRRPKSKLSGGLELFTVNDITFLEGKGELERVISTRMSENFGNIISSYERVSLGYKVLQFANKYFEHDKDSDGFKLLHQTLKQLNMKNLDLSVIELWYNMQLVKIFGHQPHLSKDRHGKDLDRNARYDFDIEQAAFFTANSGNFNADHIKTMRILSDKLPSNVSKVQGIDITSSELLPRINQFAMYWLH